MFPNLHSGALGKGAQEHVRVVVEEEPQHAQDGPPRVGALRVVDRVVRLRVLGVERLARAQRVLQR